MKRTFLMLICCLTATLCLANSYRGDDRQYKYHQEKEIEKVFDVNSNPELEIDGYYSDIIVTTWDQPQIAFKVKVSVKSDKEKQVQERFNAISVVFTQEGNKVEAETVIEKSNYSNFSGSMSIKYYVSMPEDVRMDLETKYGDIVVETVKKNFKAKVKYGSLTAGNLLSGNEIDLKHSDMNIAYAKNLNLEMKYCDGKINKVDFIDADVEYSDLTATEVFRGIFDNEYSDIKIEKIKDLRSENKYSDMRATINGVEPNVEINADYSDINLTINENTSFRYDIRVRYGDIICGKIMGSNAGRTSDGHIAGRHGEDTPGIIKAELEYGDIRIE